MMTETNEILGTDEADRLQGTDANELIRGLAGDDNIRGGGGNDIITGGEGVDRILGEDGNDIIWDPSGEDVITGGDGNDILIGGSVMNGDGGDDLLVSTGSSEEVLVIGSAGSDIIIGSDETAENYSYLLFAREQSDPDNPDTIYNFQSGQDTFDFFGEQPSLVFIDDAEFSGRDDFVAEARFENERLEFDIDGDQVADLAMLLPDVESLTADDFISL